MDQKKVMSLGEEIWNSITHGIGAILGIIGFIFLLLLALKKNDIWRTIGFSIFGINIILTYILSTLYHSLSFTKAKKVFQILDQSAIFLLIAGTYTAFVLTTLRDTVGWILLAIVWSFAITGLILKTIYINNFTIFYLILGWLAIFVIQPLWQHLGANGFLLLLTGGVFYTIGSVFYINKKIPFNHGIWHMFVLGGSICHFFALYSLN